MNTLEEMHIEDLKCINSELLEALEVMVELFYAYQVIGSINEGLDISIAHEAIKKAKGES